MRLSPLYKFLLSGFFFGQTKKSQSLRISIPCGLKYSARQYPGSLLKQIPPLTSYPTT
jgi:hypothetical protein